MVIDHMVNVSFNVFPLLECLTVPTLLIEAVATLQLEPDGLVVVHIHIVATVRYEDVHGLESALVIASLEHLHS